MGNNEDKDKGVHDGRTLGEMKFNFVKQKQGIASVHSWPLPENFTLHNDEHTLHLYHNVEEGTIEVATYSAKSAHIWNIIGDCHAHLRRWNMRKVL